MERFQAMINSTQLLVFPNRSNSIARQVKHVTLLTLFCSFAGLATAANTNLINRQQQTIKILGDYQKTADGHKRKLVHNAVGTSEIIATRIFQAFDTLSGPGIPRDDRTINEAAWEELFRNATMSIATLRPVLFEKGPYP